MLKADISQAFFLAAKPQEGDRLVGEVVENRPDSQVSVLSGADFPGGLRILFGNAFEWMVKIGLKDVPDQAEITAAHLDRLEQYVRATFDHNVAKIAGIRADSIRLSMEGGMRAEEKHLLSLIAQMKENLAAG